MRLQLTWLNGFLLILPLLLWNLALGGRITDPRVTSDANSPGWLLAAENITRVLVFALPLFIPMPRGADWHSAVARAGLVVYSVGTLVYFASWLPLLLSPGSAWSNSALGLLSPRLTPLLSFLGIALLGGAWPYGLISAVFVIFHTWHGIQNM